MTSSHKPVSVRYGTTHVVQFARRPRATDFSIERLFEDIRQALPNDISVTLTSAPHVSKGTWTRLRDAVWAHGRQGRVNHILGDVHYLAWFLDRHRTILTVHDTGVPDRLSGPKRWLYDFLWFYWPCAKAARVVCISEATRTAVLKLSPRARTVVIPNCVSPEFRPVPSRPMPDRPRILHIGCGPSKNLPRLAEALDGVPCRLVIVGKPDVKQLAALSRHRIDYEIHFAVPREKLKSLYGRCDLVAFVSTFEGFGLPVLEAQAVGRPVVTSTVWSLPEVAGPGACLVDPFDAGAIRAAIQRIIADADYRAKLIAAGAANVANYSAEIAAARYAALYREVAAERNNSHVASTASVSTA